MGDKQEYKGKDIIIFFDKKKCIHSRNCVLGQPRVFAANVRDAWIRPDEGSAEFTASVIRTCPSGALTYERLSSDEKETPPEVNVARTLENGPISVHADIRIKGEKPELRATLCRCGASKNKPFCDGTHKTSGFTATGEPHTKDSKPLKEREGPLEITPSKDGPLALKGNVEICSGTGRTVTRTNEAYLCRCGGSSNKPFCDGTHKKIGFKAG